MVFLHVSKGSTKQECVRRVSRDDDSDFESDFSSNSGSDSDSVFNSDSYSDSESDACSNSNYNSGFEEVQTDEGKGSRKLATDWIIVAHESNEALWIELDSLDKRYSAGIPLAAHPSLPIVVAGQTNGQAIIVNNDTGKWHVIEYPATLENGNAVLLHQREYHSISFCWFGGFALGVTNSELFRNPLLPMWTIPPLPNRLFHRAKRLFRVQIESVNILLF